MISIGDLQTISIMEEQPSLFWTSIRRIAIAWSLLGLITGGATASEIPRAHREKLSAVTKLWEYERREFLQIITLGQEDRDYFAKLLRQHPPEGDRDSAALLLAVNCVTVPKDQTRYYALQEYLCAGATYESLSELALQNPYVLAFSKAT